MNATEAALMAREYLYGVLGILPDMWFETGDISRFDFKEWEVECRVFSMLTSKMMKYQVIIHDDEVTAIKEMI